jgi:RNA exonuclease 1
MEELVMPLNPIIDYATQYSGITKELLEGVTCTLHDVQQKLLSMVFEETILVGHSLENDLLALKMYHGRVIDTSLLYPHPSGPPMKSSLKYLTRGLLQRTIQNNGTNGHDSREDAIAALELAQLKIKKG